MDEPIGNDIATDKLVMDDNALHVQRPRTWSDMLHRFTVTTQAKANLNPHYPLQANLDALVQDIADQHAKFDLRPRIRGSRESRGIREFRETRRFDKSPETVHLERLKCLVMETLRHRQLEILCRYGDYLAERLGTLCQHISENKLKTEHKLSEYWTETSAILKGEEGLETAPCHNLIRTAALGLNWKPEAAIFMVHEYAKRNNLMHAEMFNLVDSQDWDGIEQRCKEDIVKLHELFIDLGPDSQAAIENWMQIIGDFRDRWVSQSKDGTTWEARSIIKEAIVAGVNDRVSLNKLTMLPKDATITERNKALNNLVKENSLKEAQRKKMQLHADDALQAKNRQLQAEVEQLKSLLTKEAPEDFFAKLEGSIRRIDELEKKNEGFQKRVEQLQVKCGESVTRERALSKKLKDLGVAEMTNRDTRKTSGDAEGKEINTGEKNIDVGENDSGAID